MLQDKYLPNYHFNERHAISIQSPVALIWRSILELDLRGSPLIRILFMLRGMPAGMMTFRGLERAKFVRLEEKPNEELILGLIGQFWRPSGNLQEYKPGEFASFSHPGFAKAAWNFRICPKGNVAVVETETRIFCTDQLALKNFSRYWWLVRPFSGVIRKEMLKCIRRQCKEHQHSQQTA